MGANEEQLVLVTSIGADHPSYILCVISLACVMELWMLGLLDLYLRLRGGGSYAAVSGGDDNDIGDFGDFEDDIELAPVA